MAARLKKCHQLIVLRWIGSSTFAQLREADGMERALPTSGMRRAKHNNRRLNGNLIVGARSLPLLLGPSSGHSQGSKCFPKAVAH